MLTAADLERMADTVTASMPEDVNILRGTRVPDGGGGWDTVWGTAATTKARIGPLRGEEPERGSRVGEEADWRITLPTEADVTTDDRIEAQWGTFAVVALDTRRSYQVSTRLSAREVFS